VAALFGRVEIIKFLLTKGLPIDEPNDFCLTPVYYAAVNGHLDTVKYMVENHQVNIDCETLLGTTMLDETIKRGYANVVEYLENKNAKRNMEDMSDYSSRKGKIDETIVNILSDRLIKRLSESI
jgi:ankyrin repeat protein